MELRPTLDAGRGGVGAVMGCKGLKVIICVPLIAMQSVVGVLNLAASRPIELDQGEIDLFAVIGNQIAIAILNARLYETERV